MKTYQKEFTALFRGYLIGTLFNDRTLLSSYRQLLKPVYFEDALERLLVRILLEFWDRNKELPDYISWQEFSAHYLAEDVDDHGMRDCDELGGPSEALRKVIQSGIRLLREHTGCKMNNYLRGRLVDFSKEYESLLVLQRMIELKKNNRLDLKVCVKEFDRVSSIGVDQADIGVEFWDTCDNLDDEKIEFIPFGIKGLDVALGGGGVRGEMVGLVAPPKGFKTGTMLNITKNLSMQGFNVAYASGEESDKRLKAKIRSSITGVSPEAQRKDPVLAAKLIRAAESSFDGKIFIKKFKTRQFSAKSIEAWLNALGTKIDVLVIDFLDLMRSDRDKSNIDHLERVSISEEARELGDVFNCAVLTANKGSKETVEAAIFDAEGIGLAFGKGYVFDSMVGIAMTTDQIQAGELSMFIIYNRYGPAKSLIGCKVDLEHTQLSYSPEVTEKVKSEILGAKTGGKKGKNLSTDPLTFMNEQISDEVMKLVTSPVSSPKSKKKMVIV